MLQLHHKVIITFLVTFVFFVCEAFLHYYVGKSWDFSQFPSWEEVGEIVGITAAVSLLSSLVSHFVISKIKD